MRNNKSNQLNSKQRGKEDIKKNDIKLPPVKIVQLKRPADFGKLPSSLSARGNQNEEESAVKIPPAIETTKALQDHNQSLVSREFELGQIMGYGNRFITTVTLAICQFRHKDDIDPDSPSEKTSKDETKLEFASKIITQGGILLLTDESMAANTPDE